MKTFLLILIVFISASIYSFSQNKRSGKLYPRSIAIEKNTSEATTNTDESTQWISLLIKDVYSDIFIKIKELNVSGVANKYHSFVCKLPVIYDLNKQVTVIIEKKDGGTKNSTQKIKMTVEKLVNRTHLIYFNSTK